MLQQISKMKNPVFSTFLLVCKLLTKLFLWTNNAIKYETEESGVLVTFCKHLKIDVVAWVLLDYHFENMYNSYL